MNGLHGIIFCYKKTPGLRELIEHRMPASVPFGGRYRVIDFMLSSFKSAGVTDVGVVMQGDYQSLLDHIGNGKIWDMSRKTGGLKLLPVFGKGQQHAQFRGLLEALAAVRSYLDEIRQDYVVLSDSDLIINLPLDEVLRTHLETGADITAVCTGNAAVEDGTYFKLDDSGRVTQTLCAPRHPEGYRGVEVYILSRELLLRLVDECAAQDQYSFRGDVLAARGASLHIHGFVWDGYAAQLRTVREYYERSMELLSPPVRAELFCARRPICAKEEDEGASYLSPESRCVRSLVADGCTVEGTVEGSILFPGVTVERGAVVKNCVLFKGVTVGAGAQLQCVIADKRASFHAGCTLSGAETYPLVVAKGETI